MDVIRGNVNLEMAALGASALMLLVLATLSLNGLATEGTFVGLAVVLQDLHGERVLHVLDPGLDGDDVDVVVLCDILGNYLSVLQWNLVDNLHPGTSCIR